MDNNIPLHSPVLALASTIFRLALTSLALPPDKQSMIAGWFVLSLILRVMELPMTRVFNLSELRVGGFRVPDPVTGEEERPDKARPLTPTPCLMGKTGWKFTICTYWWSVCHLKKSFYVIRAILAQYRQYWFIFWADSVWFRKWTCCVTMPENGPAVLLSQKMDLLSNYARKCTRCLATGYN